MTVKPDVLKPFSGARKIQRVPLRLLLPYLNELSLFEFQWGYKKEKKQTREEWSLWANKNLAPVLNELVRVCSEDKILVPAGAYGYFDARREGDDLILSEGGSDTAHFRFGRKILDRHPDKGFVALQLVTMGGETSRTEAHWKEEGRYKDYAYLSGLSSEMAEAMAEYVNERIDTELGGKARRYSFGYPDCPPVSKQNEILKLLNAKEVGVSLSETGMLVPEKSTSALVFP